YQSTYAKSPEAHPIDQLVQNRCAGGLFGILLIAGSGSRIPLGSCVVVDHCSWLTNPVHQPASGFSCRHPISAFGACQHFGDGFISIVSSASQPKSAAFRVSRGIKVDLDAPNPIEFWGGTSLTEAFFIHFVDVEMTDSAVRSRINTKKD